MHTWAHCGWMLQRFSKLLPSKTRGGADVDVKCHGGWVGWSVINNPWYFMQCVFTVQSVTVICLQTSLYIALLWPYIVFVCCYPPTTLLLGKGVAVWEVTFQRSNSSPVYKPKNLLSSNQNVLNWSPLSQVPACWIWWELDIFWPSI